MNATDIIRASAAARIDLNIEVGKLVVVSPDGLPPPADLLASIREHKPAIIRALAIWPHIDGMCNDYMARCWPLTSSDLTLAERVEAEALASDLAATGGLGRFAICVTGGWNTLSKRDRLASCHAWRTAIGAMELQVAA